MARRRTTKRWQRYVSDEVYEGLRRKVNPYWFKEPQTVEDEVFLEAETFQEELINAGVSFTGIEEALVALLNEGAVFSLDEFTPTFETSDDSCVVTLDHQELPVRVQFQLEELARLLHKATREFTRRP